MRTDTRLKSDFIERTSKAYNRFQREKVPFSALKLGVDGADTQEVDQVVGRHLRETDEIIGQGDNSYAILMEGTSFEAAITASKRLANNLMGLNKSKSANTEKLPWNASFEIIGCRKGSEGFSRTLLELNQNDEDMQKKKTIPRELQNYIQHQEAMTKPAVVRKSAVNILV